MNAIVNSPQNALILEALVKRAKAETWSYNMRTAAFGAAALGALAICSSAALVIYANGTAFAEDWMANAGKSFGTAFREVVGNIPLHGNVEMAKPGTLLLRQDAPLHATGDVTVHQDKPFAIAQDKPLQVTGSITANIARPTESQLAATAQPASKAKVVTNFTIFRTVDFPPGEVVTGWKFDDASQDRPSHQYCYYSQKMEENAQATLDIGDDGKFKRPKRVPKGLNVAAAFQNCVWDQ